MLSENERTKTTKAERKRKKRENIIQRKALLPAPKNIRYHIDDQDEMARFTGDVDNKAMNTFLRFKLSGQQEFATYGYPAKIAIGQTSFCFEIPLAALLDEDVVTIQLFNEQGQMSQLVACPFVKPLYTPVQKINEHVIETPPLSRAKKYQK